MSMIAEIEKVTPEEVLDRLMDVRDRETKLSWDYGSVANEVYSYVVANDLKYTKLEVCGFVAYKVDNHRKPNTIMRYALVAEFFASKKSAERYDFLPFSHFELAMHMGKDWRKVLEKSASLMAGANGRPPSRAKLEAEFITSDEKGKERPKTDRQEIVVRLSSVAQDDGFDLIGEVQNLLSQLQSKIPAMQSRYPAIAPLVAQALILIQEALRKTNETPTEPEYV